ncbi:hypothetical protein E8E13_009410 [Curvularia kusanoi]|uniref:Uncharacterized protein n=1 Tax=Curvularia kusanoi TaxID=90978 RepID=A0A9P4TLA0_CURKU|nr:hypothetical protein E8E13_009410 [Curvularia kusanoi]
MKTSMFFAFASVLFASAILAVPTGRGGYNSAPSDTDTALSERDPGRSGYNGAPPKTDTSLPERTPGRSGYNGAPPDADETLVERRSGRSGYNGAPVVPGTSVAGVDEAA